MKEFVANLRRKFALLAVAIIFLMPAIASAKDAPAPEPQGSSFLLSYILVILCIVLGVVAVVRPTKPTVADSDL